MYKKTTHRFPLVLAVKFSYIVLRLAELGLCLLPASKLKLRLAQASVQFATHFSTGRYSSAILEKVFFAEARSHSIPLDEAEPDTVLHVMTYCYETGGHTRVVERWIEAALRGEKHSLIFTAGERQKIPERLCNAVMATGGGITHLPDTLSATDKGLQLRRDASRYSKVVLHIHMFDVVPLVAFGTPEFQSPVFFFNHADHRFWVGVGIADCVVQFRNWGRIKGLDKKRGLGKTFDIGLPPEEKNIPWCHDRAELRKKLGLPEQGRIILSAGSDFKYTPQPGYDFSSTVDTLLTSLPKAVFVIIGPSAKMFEHCRHHDRLHLPGLLPPAKLYEYMSCADLVIDSFPMSGATALMDAVICGCPVLSRDNPTGQLSYIMNSPAYCSTEKELTENAIWLLNDDAKSAQHRRLVYAEWQREFSENQFAQNVQKLYKTCTSHSMTGRFSHNGNIFSRVTDLDIFLCITQKRLVPLVVDATAQIAHRIYNAISSFFSKKS